MAVGAQDAADALAASLEGWSLERDLDLLVRRSASDVRALVLSADLAGFRAAWPAFEHIGTTWIHEGC